jgi:hypothetical protein
MTDLKKLVRTIEGKEIEKILDSKGYDYNKRFEEIEDYGNDDFVYWAKKYGIEMVDKMADECDIDTDPEDFIVSAVDKIFNEFILWCEYNAAREI